MGATPRITAPVEDEVFGATGLVYGTGEPGRTITVHLDDAEFGTTLVDERGDWLFRVPTAIPEGYRTVVLGLDRCGHR